MEIDKHFSSNNSLNILRFHMKEPRCCGVPAIEDKQTLLVCGRVFLCVYKLSSLKECQSVFQYVSPVLATACNRVGVIVWNAMELELKYRGVAQ